MSKEPSGSKQSEPRVINVLSSSSQVGSSKRAGEEDENAPLVISLDIEDCGLFVGYWWTWVVLERLVSKYDNTNRNPKRSNSACQFDNRVHRAFCYFQGIFQPASLGTPDHIGHGVFSCRSSVILQWASWPSHP